MSGDYISREAAIKEVYRFDDYLDDDLEWRLHYALKKLPAADVVEVVRCRDCKHYVESDEVNGEFMCVKDADWCVEDGCYYGFTAYPPAEFYCADGKRKDGGQDECD